MEFLGIGQPEKKVLKYVWLRQEEIKAESQNLSEHQKTKKKKKLVKKRRITLEHSRLCDNHEFKQRQFKNKAEQANRTLQ